jgi:hypothetical protein
MVATYILIGIALWVAVDQTNKFNERIENAQ